MMPPENLPTAKSPVPAKTQETGASGSRKPTPAGRSASAQGLKCPRCDSSNTKFCYYNNYSLSQPRHFCKTCRRCWTNGGALRNIPIGGGCRKNKKIKSSASKALSYDSKDDSFNKLDISNLSLFSGLSQNVNFGLSGLSLPPRMIHNHLPQIPTPSLSTGYSQLPSPSFTDVAGFQPDPPAATSNSLLGLNYPFPGNGFTGVNSMNINSGLNAGVNGGANGGINGGINGGLASSIESLSHMNQDLHLKLQQQRMAMMYSGDTQNGEIGVSVSRHPPPVVMENRPQVIENRNELQPVFFRDISGPEILPPGSGFGNGGPIEGTRREWFFGNSLLPVTPSTTATTIGGGNGHGINNSIGGSNHWSDVNAWGDFQQPYSGLP